MRTNQLIIRSQESTGEDEKEGQTIVLLKSGETGSAKTDEDRFICFFC